MLSQQAFLGLEALSSSDTEGSYTHVNDLYLLLPLGV